MDFPNHARLIYSDPVSPELSRTFGPGWTRLPITRPDGSTLPIIPDEPLTAEGGVIFSTVGATARSHDGRYVVLGITRNGVTETEDGKHTVVSREYCPILDTQTGCVARDYPGAVCGGTWGDQDAGGGRPGVRSHHACLSPCDTRSFVDKSTKLGTMISVVLFSRHSISPCPESVRCSEPPA